MTANVAAEGMPLVDTMAGEMKLTPAFDAVDPFAKANCASVATFRVKQLMGVRRIGPWFSGKNYAFNKRSEAAAKATAEFTASANGEGILEVGDMASYELVVNEDAQ